MKLSTKVGPFRFKNPILLASGTYGYGKSSKTLNVDSRVSQLGGFITKTITIKERLGNNPPRIVETASGIINSVGLENPGMARFCAEYLPEMGRLKTVRIISIGGASTDEIIQAIKLFQQHKYRTFDGIELNISCPNVKMSGRFIQPLRAQSQRSPDYFGAGAGCIAQSPVEVRKTVQKVLKVARLPIIVKLSPNVTDIVEIANSALKAGAKVLSLINTVSALAVDYRTGKPMLGGVTGGLSGPAIKPIALKMVADVASKTKAEVIGIGGIMNAKDVLEFLSVGAKAVQVGTLNLVDPFAVFDLPAALKKYITK
ncbi:MAG: dihydroorotate dehydrogenase [Planctomycetes bacterium]|nr:dihydroorotate dehydrogenase [Planctomycetota bacterium]